MAFDYDQEMQKYISMDDFNELRKQMESHVIIKTPQAKNFYEVEGIIKAISILLQNLEGVLY